MKSLTAAALCLLLALLASAPAARAQSRTRRASTSSAQKRRAGGRTDQTQVNAARIKLADRVKALSQFLYLYGRLTKDLELTGAQGAAPDAVAKSKASVLGSLRNVREGLDELVAQFRFTPGLERQSEAIKAAAERAADAESRAAAGQYHQAGLTLVEAVRQLTDALIDM